MKSLRSRQVEYMAASTPVKEFTSAYCPSALRKSRPGVPALLCLTSERRPVRWQTAALEVPMMQLSPACFTFSAARLMRASYSDTG